MNVLVSVIVPMYNVARLIKPCVESLFAQTYNKLELIFIDDCSNDNTLDVLNQIISQHEDTDIIVKIISHTENKGVAAARNTGLDNATGKYVYYVDADDFIEDNAIEIMLNEAVKNDSDIVSCEWFLEFNRNSRHMVQPNINNGESLFKQMCYGKARWNLWLFLVKRSIYENYSLRFVPGVNMGEDMMMMLKISLLSKKASTIHRPLYHYIQTNSSAISKDIRPYIPQIKDNVANVEDFIHRRLNKGHEKELIQLKLALKLPLLISSDTSNYHLWLHLWPECNNYINNNPEQSWRTKLIQNAAQKKMFFINKLYFWCVVKVVYGLIFK